MLPPDSTVTTLADLQGKKLGIAGGPVDKSWLVIRAAAAQRHGIELDQAVEKDRRNARQGVCNLDRSSARP
jgi:NitT/TauT family transport system substrate-binding protein